MAITLEEAGTQAAQATGGTLSVPQPVTGILANDIFLLNVLASSATAPTNPSGYVSRTNGTSGGSSPSFRMSTKVCTGLESGNQAVTVPSTVPSKGRIFRYRGVDSAVVIDVASPTPFGSSTAVTAYTIPGVTIITPGSVLVTFQVSNAASGAWNTITSPITFIEDWDDIVQLSAGTQHAAFVAAGATGNILLTRTSSVRGCAGAVILRPAADPNAGPFVGIIPL